MFSFLFKLKGEGEGVQFPIQTAGKGEGVQFPIPAAGNCKKGFCKKINTVFKVPAIFLNFMPRMRHKHAQ